MMKRPFDRLGALRARTAGLLPRSRRMRDLLLLAVLLLLGTLTALVIYEPWRSLRAPAVDAVVVDGQRIETGPRGIDALRRLARERVQRTITLSGGGISHRTALSDIGVHAELSSLERIIVELGREDSPAARYYRDVAGSPLEVKLELPLSLESSDAVEALVAVKETLDRAPEDARFDFASNTVVPEKKGLSLDVYGTLMRLDDAIVHGAGEVKMVVRDIAPGMRAADLMGIDVDTVAGFFETPYSRMKKDEDRTHNVRLGASILDGQVIMPGGVFSFNDVVGDRSEARGFRYAPVIEGGKIVEGMGGGTCQVASTLYAAAFFTGLTIEERVPHSRPSSYIKLGLDATVSYPSKNLKIRNPLPWPVAIHFTAEDGMARVEFRGKERPFTVSLLRRIVSSTDYPVKTVDDPDLPRGREVITQRGVPGYRVQRHRIIERAKVAYMYQSYDRYPPTTEFVHRGTGDPVVLKQNGTAPPKEDTHNPYRASSSLRMVQGPDVWYEKNHD